MSPLCVVFCMFSSTNQYDIFVNKPNHENLHSILLAAHNLMNKNVVRVPLSHQNEKIVKKQKQKQKYIYVRCVDIISIYI